MQHIAPLISDLALILAVAAGVTMLCKSLKQPVVLGYILAGTLVGPQIKALPTVSGFRDIQVWAELGVIFLLFGLGLEFSFRKLLRVGPAASITACVEVAVMLGLGFLTGRLLGWNSLESLFLGGVLSISSTTIILRAFEELGLKSRGFVSLVFGVLVVEDLVAVLLLVLLSTVAVSQQLQGGELLLASAKLGFFLMLWFLGGIFLVPTLLRRFARHLNDETLLVVSLALCLGMVVLAHLAGFSPALGAFVMGSILAETPVRSRIEHLIAPIRDFFAAVFFVSVGLMVDMTALWDHKGTIALVSVITVAGKVFSTSLGALIAGKPPKTALQAGMSLAQIGEFSFIIASLGLSLKVVGPQLYPIAVSVSVVTTFLTPYLIRSADPLFAWIWPFVPAKLRESSERYAAGAQQLSAVAEWRIALRKRAVRVLLNLFVVAAVAVFVDRVLMASIAATFGPLTNLAACASALLLSGPFLWAVAFGGEGGLSLRELWSKRNFRTPIFAFEAARVGLAGLSLVILAYRYLPNGYTLGLGLALVGIASILSTRYLGLVYGWFEERFLKNLEENPENKPSPAPAPAAALAPWDAHIAEFPVPAFGPFLGRTFQELGIRERFGVTVALIERGGRRMPAPGRDERVFPHDRLSVIGTDEQLAAFENFLRVEERRAEGENGLSDYSLEKLYLDGDSPLLGRTIRDSGLRESTHGLVVGIERDGKRMLNPDSQLSFRAGDHVWVVGDRRLIRALRESESK